MRKLVIGVSRELADSPEVQALSSRTCEVKIVDIDCDILLGDRCWYMPLTHARYVPVAVKAVRKLLKESA